MGVSRWNMAVVAAVVTLFSCVGLPWKQSVGAEPPRIVDGSTGTFIFQMTVPGEYGLEVHHLGQFVQGRHQLLPALEREVIGMKTGDEKKVQLSAEESFGPYNTKKKKTVPKSDLPAGTKEGDILECRAGQQATITQLSDQSAVVNDNHPLAGKPLAVRMKILRVDNPI